MLVEACVDAIDAAIEAERGGAGRIELCGELLQGGVTPSAGLIGAVRDRVAIPVFVLIRPRTGDFLYSAEERDVMRRDVTVAKALGAHGVVIGALTAHGDVDVDFVRELVALAKPMQVTFHRAFDFARDQDVALDDLVAAGVDRVLTSGGAASALEGAASLSRLIARAAGRITVLAGGSITASNAADVARMSRATEVHARAAERVASGMRHRRSSVSLARASSLDDYDRIVTQAGEVARIVNAIRSDAAGSSGGIAR